MLLQHLTSRTPSATALVVTASAHPQNARLSCSLLCTGFSRTWMSIPLALQHCICTSPCQPSLYPSTQTAVHSAVTEHDVPTLLLSPRAVYFPRQAAGGGGGGGGGAAKLPRLAQDTWNLPAPRCASALASHHWQPLRFAATGSLDSMRHPFSGGSAATQQRGTGRHSMRASFIESDSSTCKPCTLANDHQQQS